MLQGTGGQDPPVAEGGSSTAESQLTNQGAARPARLTSDLNEDAALRVHRGALRGRIFTPQAL